MRFAYSSELIAIIFLNCIIQFIFVMNKECVFGVKQCLFCAIGPEFKNNIWKVKLQETALPRKRISSDSVMF
jgi:hypothetical protein